jgi:hypothetical protein
MSVLIAQLGDIHLEEAHDPAMTRAPYIGAAIAAEVDKQVLTVILAVCGDAAFCGTKTQFDIAMQFVEAIEHELRTRCDSIEFELIRIAVPGNHDCDFSGDQAARNALLRCINASEKPADSIIKNIMPPLTEYFSFARRLSDRSSITEDHQFYRPVDVMDGSATLRLHLINTAWMSSLHEQPGSLHFPLTEIAPPETRADCSIAILHHPTHWFSQPHAMRPLRDRLGEIASVVLVNHEHTPEAKEEVPLMDRDGTATRTIYVSGGVIQECGKKETCSFILLKVDVAAKSLQMTRHELRTDGGTFYFERTGEESVGLSATELTVGPAGAALSKPMIEFLEDPGAPISHPNRDPRIPVKLSDIFLFPDLWELDAEHDGSDQKQIKSGKVAEEILGHDRSLITGGEKSGRTAIVKRLFMSAFDGGKVPVFLKGGDVPNRIEKVRNWIRDAVKEQYTNLTPDQFEQLHKQERVVLVDDVHRMAPAKASRNRLLEELERQFGTVVLCGDDLIKMDEMSGADPRESGLWEYRHLIILGFGEFLRGEFVRQWLMLGGETVPEDEQLEQEVDRICSLLNVVIKKQLLPAYPLFLLVILQQSDLANASVQSGSFGKLFEGLMTAILNKSSFTRINISDKYHYLAALAKRMYDGETMSLSTQDATTWHKEYWNQIELDIDFDRLTEDLRSLGVLTVMRFEIRFKYAYFFCFFVAYHLNRTLHEPESKNLVRTLSRQLYHRVSAEIILFLAHLTGDPIVLSEMVENCESLFSDVDEATLDDDVAPLNKLASVVETISVPSEPDHNKRELRIRRDAEVSERLAATKSTHEVVAPKADNDVVKRLFDLHAAYKTIQILGQALRNISGSASKDRKGEIIDRIIGLARRVLGVYFEIFKKGVLELVIEDLAAAHKELQPELAISELRDEVFRHLNGLSQFVCFSIIKHTTFSVGSENLAQTIHRVLSSDNATVVKLLDLSFDLERPKHFPRDAALKLYRDLGKNHFSASLVRMLVAHHMYLYVVPIQDRQSVCEKMNITLLPSVMDRSRKRLT